jgi:hypothetical protein
VLDDDLALMVEEGEHLARGRDGQACAGMSFLQDDVILYAATPHSQRANFTLAHELGHLLINWAGLYDWLSPHDNLAMVMETVAHLALAARAREDPGRVLCGRWAWLRFAERVDELAAFAAGLHPAAGTDAVAAVSAAFGRRASDLMAYIKAV